MIGLGCGLLGAGMYVAVLALITAPGSTADGLATGVIDWSWLAAFTLFCTLVGQWYVRGYQAKQMRGEIGERKSEHEKLEDKVALSATRAEMTDALRRLEDQVDGGFKEVERRIDGLYSALHVERRKEDRNP